MIGILLVSYCHLSVCLSVYAAVQCGQMIHPTAKPYQQVNRNCPYRNRILQLLTPTPTLSPQHLHPKNFEILLIYYIVFC